MKTIRRKKSARRAPLREIAVLRARLAEAEETLRAIRAGETDAVVVSGKRGQQVFTLEGARARLPRAHRIHERRRADADD